MLETLEQIGGRALGPDEVFRFECGPDVACFGACCRNKRLPLGPYDILRLRRALNLSSTQVLERYADLGMDAPSGFPALTLRLEPDGRCPFIGPDGCGVYEHRPAACRLYPLARAVKPQGPGRPPEVIHIRQETPGCQGWDRGSGHTASSYTLDQGLALYHRSDDWLLPLYFHPRRHRGTKLEPAQIHGVVAALYNLDAFRESLNEPALKKRFGALRIRDARESDDALLLLGRDFLLDTLFGMDA
jgi:Fe-S-cluster containining protein